MLLWARVFLFFFFVAPFCSCPASWVSRKFFAVGPGCPKCFFLLRSVGRCDLSAGPEQKKKHHPGCFFFAPAPGKGRGRRSPVGRRHGARVFLLWPRAGAQRGFSFPCLSPGPQQKQKHPGWCFFLLWPRAGAQRGFSFPCLSPGPQQKKKQNTLGGVFFFAAAPRGRSLTHCGPGWRCLPLPGWCFFFLLRPRPDRGGGFLFLLWPRPDAHSLTVGWGDFGKARVVFFFFAVAPAGLFRQ